MAVVSSCREMSKDAPLLILIVVVSRVNCIIGKHREVS